MPPALSPPVIALVGPTASGKSTAALEIAQQIGGEIVNADAMALYRGMDIGTAKLPVDQRGGVPHHLLDIWEVRQRASVVEYQGLARRAVGQIRGRGRVPVVVGGSGLYVQALLDSFQFPATDSQVRARLEQDLAAEGPGLLHERLARLDPTAAQRIPAANPRRVIRALEVIELTGRPYAAVLPTPRSYYPGTRLVGIDPPRPELYARIERRVRDMFDAGLRAEVQALEAHGLREGVTASRALGYRQVLEDPATAEERTAAATRTFARRQRSWFRRDLRIEWVTGAQEAVAALVTTGRMGRWTHQ